MKKIISIAASALAVFGMMGCDAPSEEVVAPFEIVASQRALVVGETLQLNVTAGTGVTWTSSAASVATVSSAGLVTAVAPGSAIIKAAIGTVEKTFSIVVEAAPDYVAPAYAGLTKAEIDATPCVTDYTTAFDQGWNFGWHLATLDATASKIDITLGTQSNHDGQVAWHAKGGSMIENGGWCASMYALPQRGEVAPVNSVIYNKVNLQDVAATSQFRIWGCVTGFPWRSGNGNLKVSAVVERGGELKEVVLPIKTTTSGSTTGGTYKIEADGSYSYDVGFSSAVENSPLPGFSDPDGMMIFDIAPLQAMGMYGNAEIVVTLKAGAQVLNNDDSNAINNWGVDNVTLNSHFGLKRLGFC